MIINIIGCGETGANWDGTGHSIGVNDCWKFGKPTDLLMVLNRRSTFTPDRIKIIEDSKPKDFYCNLEEWRRSFNDMKLITTTRWNNAFINDVIYHSKTSPFCAMSLAYNLGFRTLVLWGVDFQTHHIFSPGKYAYDNEKLMYHSFIKVLKDKGCKVYAGCYGSTLELPVYVR
jgi:hypothetical protein